MAAARFPAKAPARTAAAEAQYWPGFPGRGEMSRRNARVNHGEVKAHLPPLPGSEARKGRGEGQQVRAIVERGRELSTEGVESGRVFGRSCQSVWFSASSRRSAREYVPAELTLHERHEAVVLRVDTLKGSRDFLSFFSFGFMCKCLWGGACGGYSRTV